MWVFTAFIIAAFYHSSVSQYHKDFEEHGNYSSKEVDQDDGGKIVLTNDEPLPKDGLEPEAGIPEVRPRADLLSEQGPQFEYGVDEDRIDEYGKKDGPLSRHKRAMPIVRQPKEDNLEDRTASTRGEVTNKKIQNSQIMGSIQLGIEYTTSPEHEKDFLIEDFLTMETKTFPVQGGKDTPYHHYPEFTFKTYAPVIFYRFRNIFGIQRDDFKISFRSSHLRDVPNYEGSGSIFYLTTDDKYIITIIEHKERKLLLKILPGYVMNLNQDSRTLLPKYFGLYTYQSKHNTTRIVVMNNLLPSSIHMHQKYHLKGSTDKTNTSESERNKKSSTYWDQDFMNDHPQGIFLEAETYTGLIKTIQRDCLLLESFNIMDYSLLVGIHNLDQEAKERSVNNENHPAHHKGHMLLGGIPAKNDKGERLLLYLGIIDVLQSYGVWSKFKETWKSLLHGKGFVSEHYPVFYAKQFQDFIIKNVFKQSPSRT